MAGIASFRRSIAARLVLIVMVVAGPLVALQFYYAFAEAAFAEQEALVQSSQAAQLVLSRIERQIGTVNSLLSTIAVTVPTQRNAIEQGNAVLHRVKAGLPDYIGSISLLEPDGTMLYSAEPSPPAYRSVNVADRSYFKDAISSGSLAVGQPIISRTSGKWVVVFARAIHDGVAVRGVVSMSIHLEKFQEAFTEAGLPRNALVTVMDRNGVVLARSIDPQRWVGTNLSGFEVVKDALLEHKAAKEVVSRDGGESVSVMTASSLIPWLVQVSIPSETVFAASQSHLKSAILLTLLVTALTVGTAAWISRGIARPLRRLALDAAKLAGGDLSHRSTVVAKGEVGELAASFNRMAQELELRSNTLRATFEQAAVGIARVSPDGRCLQVNQRLCDILGYAREALLDHNFREITCCDDADNDRELERRLLEGQCATYSVEKRLICRRGNFIWTNLTVSLVRADSGAPDYFLYVIEDIARRKHSEALNTGQKQVLEMIAGGAQLQDTLNALLHIIEAQCAEMLCSVLLLDDDGVHLRHGAAPSLPAEYMRAIDGAPIGAHAGSCGTAAFLHQTVFVEDIAHDPLWADYRELALRYGLRSCWSTPIFDAARRLLGTFAIYYREPSMPTAHHLELIAVATHTAAIAIAHQRAEVDRARLLHEIEKAREDAVVAHDLLSSVFSRMNDGIVALDRNWRYTYVNWNAAQFLNRDKPEDLIGKHIWTEYPEGIDQPFAKAYREAMDTQRVIYLENYYAPWDRWFENRIYPSPDGLTIYFTEITQRKHAERELRDERAMMEQITSCSPVGIIAADMEARISLINNAALKMLDVDRAEVMRRTYRSPEWRIEDAQGRPVPPEQLPFARVKMTGKPVFDGEYSIQRRDRQRVQLSVNAAPLMSESGQMQGVVFAVSDITERRRITEILRASEKKFAIAFRSSPDAILITSLADGRIVDINEAGVCLYGYRREEAIGRTTMELKMWAHPGDRERFVEELARHGRVHEIEADFRNKQGEVRIALISGELIELEGRPHLLGVIRDITEHKHAEAEILKLNAELEQRVAERTAQLEAANKELEAFSYSVSHDLKAPLRGIDGYSQLLEESAADRLDDESRLFLQNIRRGATQMQELIADLLAYARMERRVLGEDKLDLRSCVNALVQSYEHDMAGRGVVLRNDVPGLIVRADREGLGIVLRNLLDNALKFSRGAHPPIVEIGGREEAGKVILWVRDNGIGFDMKFCERIFDIFSRLQRAEDYAGTGVGLALVRKAMQRMGGRAWAESTPGQGATFFLEFKHG